MSKLFVLAWRKSLLVAFFTVVVGFLVLEANQWLFRMRAEALLADIKSLELNRSSWSDAERLMTRWGKWGGWYKNCNAENCAYGIRIYHLPFVYPDFVLEEGPHIGARMLQSVGLRSAEVTASFHVVHGVVTNKAFGMDVPLPVSQWISPGSGFWLKSEIGSVYWPSLDAGFFEGAKLRAANPLYLAKHPNRSFIERRIDLEVSFTPEESPEEQAALTDFHFDCITRWTPCTSREELLPKAEEEHEADVRDWAQATKGDAFPRPPCFPTLEIRAREEQDVLVGEVVQAEALPGQTESDPRPRDSWITSVRLHEVLKGRAPVREGEVFRAIVSCNNDGEKCSRPLSHARVILTGMSVLDKPTSETLDFGGGECGVMAASQENLAAARTGVQQDFGPRY